MGTNISIFHDNTNNSNDIVTSESNEMDFSTLIPIHRMFGMDLVNARDLHLVLGSKNEFRHWVKDRILRCDLIENEEFVIIEYDYKGNLLSIRPEKKTGLIISELREGIMVLLMMR